MGEQRRRIMAAAVEADAAAAAAVIVLGRAAQATRPGPPVIPPPNPSQTFSHTLMWSAEAEARFRGLINRENADRAARGEPAEAPPAMMTRILSAGFTQLERAQAEREAAGRLVQPATMMPPPTPKSPGGIVR